MIALFFLFKEDSFDEAKNGIGKHRKLQGNAMVHSLGQITVSSVVDSHFILERKDRS